jgi:hypothetical protein
MVIIYTKVFHCKTLQNLPKLGFLVLKTNHLATLFKNTFWGSVIVSRCGLHHCFSLYVPKPYALAGFEPGSYASLEDAISTVPLCATLRHIASHCVTLRHIASHCVTFATLSSIFGDKVLRT